jgi:DNA-binding transcriptional regulator LsrR (DeoR family)
MNKQQQKLDLAARAGWLYYVANNTQDQIAAKLNISRQAAQRLVSLADAEGLIGHRLAHPLSECIELSERLRSCFDLFCCDVAPSDPERGDLYASIGVCGAACIEGYLASKAPIVLALGGGRALRATVDQVKPMSVPQHRIVSLHGHMGPDGRASHFEAVMHLADRVNAQAFLLSTPVVARTPDECRILQRQHAFQAVRELVKQAKVAMVGIGELVWNGPLQQDGFYADSDVTELLELGAVGVVLAWAFDRNGKLVPSSVNQRVAGMPLDLLPPRRVIGVSHGENKVEAILAALRGKIVSGLITDEATARRLLEAAAG